jgi:hypothetical protein
VFSDRTYLPFELLRIAVTTALYFASIWGWGCLLAGYLLKTEEPLTDFIAARVVTGSLSLYVCFIGLASVGQLRPWAVLAIGATGLIVAALYARTAAAAFGTAWRRIQKWPRLDHWLFALVCVLAIMQIAYAFTPLIFYDSQVYQLLSPVQFLHAGYLVHIPWNVLTDSPQAIQLTLGMSWVLDQTGTTFKVLLALLACLSFLAAGHIGNECGPRAGIVAALFVAAYPEFWIHQILGVVDFAAASFLILGAIWWMESLREQDWKKAVLSGTALGFMIGSRYQGIVLVAWVLTGIMVAESVRNPRIVRGSLKLGAMVGGIIVLMTLPWLARNYGALGNPVYPLLYGFFGGGEWSAAQGLALQDAVMGTRLAAISITQKLLAPLNPLLLFPNNGLFSLPILICGLAAAYSRKLKNIRIYAVLGLGGLVLWGLIHPAIHTQVLRFNAGTLIFLLACSAAFLAREGAGKSIRLAVALILAIGSAAIATLSLNLNIPMWQTLISSDRRAAIWRANVPSWPALEFANRKLDPERNKVLFIGDTRALWLKVPFIAASAYNGPQLVELFAPGLDSSTWTQRLRELGITHILVCSSEWQRLADSTGYFRLTDDHLNRFLRWLHTLPVLFDDHQGNAVLVVS